MFDMKVTGLVLLAVSIMYTTMVAKDDANASVMIAPDADHVNTSICPGVSKIAYLKYNECMASLHATCFITGNPQHFCYM